MKHYGFRRTTRKKLKKDVRKKGLANTTTSLQVYKNGDYVDIYINSAYNKCMPHKIFHGRTGRVYKVDERTIGVAVKRVVGNQEICEKIDIRKEHLRPSKCRDEFLNRVAEYKIARQNAIENNLPLPSPKRVPKGPRKEFCVSLKENEPITVGFKRYCDLF